VFTINSLLRLTNVNQVYYLLNVDGQELYVIESKDSNQLVLSTETRYCKTAKMYIYDIEKNMLLEIIPVVKEK